MASPIPEEPFSYVLDLSPLNIGSQICMISSSGICCPSLYILILCSTREIRITPPILQNLTALENVELTLQICKDPLDAGQVLEEVGLGERKDNFPAQLSGGEQQRVAIARALAKNPKLLLCDEPTGALDYVTGKAILKLLQDTCRQRGMTVVVITHNTALTPMADRVIQIRNGQVKSMELNPHPTPVEEIEW